MWPRLALTFALLMGVTSMAQAKDISLTLTDVEQQQLLVLLDQAAKQGGIQVAGAVSYFANKLKQQAQQAAAPVPAEAPKPDVKK